MIIILSYGCKKVANDTYIISDMLGNIEFIINTENTGKNLN